MDTSQNTKKGAHKPTITKHQKVTRTLVRCVHETARNIMLLEELVCAGRGVELIAHLVEQVCRLEEGHLRLGRSGSHEDLSGVVRQTEARRNERLQEGLVLVGTEARDFAGRAHLASKDRIDTSKSSETTHEKETREPRVVTWRIISVRS